MHKLNTKPELLAPAGTIQAGLVAIDAGADAIYTGLPRFNARERGQNCSFDDVAKLIAYAHRHDSRVYVTLNTLIKERELPDVVEILQQLLAIRPDAVIIQDLGILYLIRKYFPELTPHASTQMGIHNSAGVRLAEELGIQRVILQRQVTFNEIDDIRQKTSVELEVFIHGALCVGRSGSCLFSSWMGGWSGNRGRCKQPCRRRYFSDDGNGFFFSPKDLYSLEDIPRLAAMGVSSLKIEGRLRRSDYVRNVVTAYRMMLDAAPDERAKLLPEAKRILAGAPGRKWSEPFRSEKNFGDVIHHRGMGTSGRLVGSVVRRDGNGFLAKLSSPLYLHDTIRIQPRSGEEGPGITVTKLTVNRKPSRKAPSGQTCWIACDKPVEAGANIFKTGSQTDDLEARIAKLPLPGTALDLAVELIADQVKVSLPATGQVWQDKIETQPARNRALDSLGLAAEFRRGMPDGFAPGNICASVQDGLFLPASALKNLRRSFWNWAGDKLSPESLKTAYASRLAEVAIELASPVGAAVCKNSETTVLTTSANQVEGAVTAHSIYDLRSDTVEAVLPDFCAEGDLAELEEKVSQVIERGIKRIRVTSLYGLEILRRLKKLPPDLMVISSYPLPVCNSAAFRLLQSLGVKRAGAWVELGESAIRELLEKLGDAGELITYARLPLLSTRMQIPTEGEIRDSRGATFFIKQTGRLTLLLPEKVFAIEPEFASHRFIDLTHAQFGEDAVSQFNFPRELV
jgi:putative protease